MKLKLFTLLAVYEQTTVSPISHRFSRNQLFCADKSKDGQSQSKTMMSQVSFALSTLQAKERADELPDVFEENDNEKL